ncbi:MAG: ECF transporter S component [Desulfurococcaceae archaeon]
MNNKRLIECVVFTALVYATTIAIQVSQPATGGYFNLGESMIYLAALVTSPLVAGLAGGIGAALADLSTGYAIFAPGTLVIKLVEGVIAGLLVRKLRGIHGLYKAILTSGAYTFSFIVIASVLWAGEVYIGPEKWLKYELEPLHAEIPIVVWIIIGVLMGGLVLYALVYKRVSSGEVYALAIAGSLMILGYFLYEYFISNPITGRDPIAAIAEVPINIGQVIAGISISIPIATWLRKAGFIKQ